jgi:hypothetical protein
MNAEQITNSLPPELLAQLEETFSNFSAIAIVVFLGFALWGAFQGFRRSIFRQVIHVAVTLVIAIIAFHCTSFVCDNILDSFNEMSMQEFIVWCEGQAVILPEEVQSVLLSFDMTTIGYAIAIIINTVVAPLIFAILFAIVGVVGKVVTSVLCFFVPKGQSLTYKLIGIVGGIVEGAIIACVVLLPLVGWVNIAGSAVDVVRENAAADDPAATEIVEFYDEYVEPLEKHAIFQMVGGLGGNDMLEDLATVEINGEERDLREQLTVVIELGYDISKLSGADFLNLTPENKATILAIIDDCDESLIISKLTCGVVNGMASAIEDGAILIQIDEPYHSILMEAVSILGSEKTNETTLGENLTTFVNVYFLLSDEGVLAVFDKTEDGATTNEDALTEALTKKDDENNTVLNKVIDKLDENENTRTLIPLVGKLAVAALYDTLGIPEGAEEAYEAVKDGISDVLALDTTNMSEAEAKASVTETLTETLDGIGISVSADGAEGTISSEAVEVMADYVLENQQAIKDKLEQENIDPENISDADVLNVLLSYYTEFLEKQGE